VHAVPEVRGGCEAGARQRVAEVGPRAGDAGRGPAAFGAPFGGCRRNEPIGGHCADEAVMQSPARLYQAAIVRRSR
jgi:hypothetical protein